MHCTLTKNVAEIAVSARPLSNTISHYMSKSCVMLRIYVLTLYDPFVEMRRDCSHYTGEINTWNPPNLELCSLHRFCPNHMPCHHGFVSVSRRRSEGKSIEFVGSPFVALLQLCNTLTRGNQNFWHVRNSTDHPSAARERLITSRYPLYTAHQKMHTKIRVTQVRIRLKNWTKNRTVNARPYFHLFTFSHNQCVSIAPD